MKRLTLIARTVPIALVLGATAFASGAGAGTSVVPPNTSGAVGGTSETFLDVRADGTYYDPSLGRRVFIADGRAAP